MVDCAFGGYFASSQLLMGIPFNEESPTIGITERGQYEHWALVASVLEHKDNVGILAQS
jgi:hypothetical protein